MTIVYIALFFLVIAVLTCLFFVFVGLPLALTLGVIEELSTPRAHIEPSNSCREIDKLSDRYLADVSRILLRR